jgi:hypothetical protein
MHNDLPIIVLLPAKNSLGAFFAPQKTGLSGAPRLRAPAPTFVRYAAKRWG